MMGPSDLASRRGIPPGTPRDGGSRGPKRPRVPVALTLGAGMTAVGALVWDHFSRLDAVWVVLSGLILLLALIELTLMIGLYRRAQAAVSAATAIRSASTEGALDCVITIDEGSIVREWNAAAEATFGFSKAEAIGRDLNELIIRPEDRARHRRGMQDLVASGTSPILDRRVEVTAVNARGDCLPVELTVTRIQHDPPLFTAFVRDLTDQRRRSLEIERLAAIVRSSEDAILSKDLQGVVTSWNHGAEELYGYKAAEAIGRPLVDLTIPADRVSEVDQIDLRVARGEPVAMTTKRRTKSGQTVEVSLRAFPIRDLDGDIVGVSVSAHDITDRRMREEQELRDREGRLWRRRIAEALAHDQFIFYGQPVLDAETRELHHHELLLRMCHQGRVVTPDEFLPHAESSDLIAEIDSWVIRRGIEQGRHGRVAINLSAKSLSTPGLIASIEEQMKLAGTPADNLIFEITETAAAENLVLAHRLVSKLTELGCGVSLDDFGTGYGSFTYLKHLPVTELKIDMSFIRDLRNDEVDRRVVRSIITVAKNFEMTTVAEGVEDEETLQLLLEMGVDQLQGYHLGRPSALDPEAALEVSA
jgi:PAS domain S-box-containing protein